MTTAALFCPHGPALLGHPRPRAWAGLLGTPPGPRVRWTAAPHWAGPVPPRLGGLVPRLGRASMDHRSPLGRVPPPRLGRPVAAAAGPPAPRDRPAWAACSLGQAELGHFGPKEF